MIPWYTSVIQPLVAIGLAFLLAAPPAWFGAAALKQFNAHVKDKRIRETAIELAKFADKWLESAEGLSSAEKAEEVIARLMGTFGINYARAKQATEAAVYDLHDAVHTIAATPLEPLEFIQGAPLVDHAQLAHDVSTAVVNTLKNDAAAATAMVAEGSPAPVSAVALTPPQDGHVSPEGRPPGDGVAFFRPPSAPPPAQPLSALFPGSPRAG